MATRWQEKGVVRTLDELEGHYKEPVELVVLKQIDRLDDHCRQFISASPFLVLATCGPAGVDCSPKGGEPGFVHVLNDETLLIPDRPGNNRIDSLRNIVQNPGVGLIFLIPGCFEAFRVSGSATISMHPDLLARFSDGANPQGRSLSFRWKKPFFTVGGPFASPTSGTPTRPWRGSNFRILPPHSRAM